VVNEWLPLKRIRMSTNVKYLTHCRVCDSARRERFLHLPDMPLTDDFIPAERFGWEFRHDIDIFVCEDCLTVQTQHDVDMTDYYEDYQYAVGSSQTASRFMHLLADNLLKKYDSEPKPKVLEVGSGDGEQLIAFKKLGCDVIGYEPSSTLTRLAESKGVRTIQGLFTSDSIHRLPQSFRPLDVVMLSYTFDHLPRPREFVSAVRPILNPDTGLLVVEIHDLQKIFERQEYCLFEHEHSIYLTTATVASLAAREGMTVIDFDLVPEAERRANSLIFVATPHGSRFAKQFGPAPQTTPTAFNSIPFYREQAALIERGIANLDAFVSRLSDAGKTIAGYGAGGRGVMTLAAMRTADKLQYLADKKPKHPGLVAPKSGVPVVGVDSLKKSPVDDVLVFSFGYMNEIKTELGKISYQAHQLHSLLDVLDGREHL
jgi:2-polyprenyl-3-methyl-5-hydroxy-6-metoxy-1,4-benzoquinol methylase